MLASTVISPDQFGRAYPALIGAELLMKRWQIVKLGMGRYQRLKLTPPMPLDKRSVVSATRTAPAD